MQKLTVIIPTHNEARNIAECVASVAWANEVLVVDDFSEDGTADLARAAGARVLTHEFRSPSSQKSFALEHATHDWVLSLDADERVTPGLAGEIRALLAADGPSDGYFIPIHSFFLGRRMRFGAWRNERKLRLFRRGLTQYPERVLHEAAEVRGRVGLCRGAIFHYSYRTLGDCLVKLRRYGEWGALDWRRRGRKPSVTRLVLHGPASFMRDYFLRLGLLDGPRGFLLAFFDAWQATRKEAELWGLEWRTGSRAGNLRSRGDARAANRRSGAGEGVPSRPRPGRDT